MSQENPQTRWHTNWLSPRLPWINQAIKPAEIADGLCKVMLDPKNLLEDANYNKVLPNHYVVEISSENYLNHYKPLGDILIQQWRDRLVESLMTANSRLGRKEFRFGGQLLIELRSAADLKASQARIICRVDPDIESPESKQAVNAPAPGKGVAYLELIDGGRRWPLHPGENTIGRDETCDVFLDLPIIQEKRLISSQHAVIRVEDRRCFLFDGAISGRPSANGTYLNSQRVPTSGEPLQDGDVVILAALNPDSPRIDTPGVAAFRFQRAASNAGQPRD